MTGSRISDFMGNVWDSVLLTHGKPSLAVFGFQKADNGYPFSYNEMILFLKTV